MVAIARESGISTQAASVVDVADPGIREIENCKVQPQPLGQLISALGIQQRGGLGLHRIVVNQWSRLTPRCGDTLGVAGSASTSAIIASSASGKNGFASVRIAPSICAMPR